MKDEGNKTETERDQQRMRSLISRIAGNIASGAVNGTLFATEEGRQRIANQAVDLAQRIVKKVGEL